MAEERWQDVGAAEELARAAVQPVTIGRLKLALVHRNGEFSAISGVCNHVGGPLGEGSLDGDYVVCPWHAWTFDVRTGENTVNAELKIPCFPVKVEGDQILVELE